MTDINIIEQYINNFKNNLLINDNYQKIIIPKYSIIKDNNYNIISSKKYYNNLIILKIKKD